MDHKKQLSYKLELEKQKTQLTGFAGTGLFLDFLSSIGFMEHVNKLFCSKDKKKRGSYTNLQILLNMLLLQVTGGDCLDDFNRLRADDGLRVMWQRLFPGSLTRKARKELKKQQLNDNNLPSIISPSTARRWLEKFHNKILSIKDLNILNAKIIKYYQKNNTEDVATLDMDATLTRSDKETAKYSYKNFKGFQPLNVWWAEQELMLHSEFRNGNVPAGYEQLRVFRECLPFLPDSVKEVRLRSDSAGYQHDLMEYCENSDKKIYFAISCKVSKGFKEAVKEVPQKEWKYVYRTEYKGTRNERKVRTTQQWAEVCFVPPKVAKKGKSPHYQLRYIAIREPMETELPGMEEPELPFPTCKLKNHRFKLFGLVTNIPPVEEEKTDMNNRIGNDIFDGTGMTGEEVIHWNRKRCGKSEHAHSILKSELGAGKMPSNLFGANNAWWLISIIAMNLLQMMKILILDDKYSTAGAKKIRYNLIVLPGRIITRSRQLIIRIANGCHAAFDLWQKARNKMLKLLYSSG
jgi:hypothetical protein